MEELPPHLRAYPTFLTEVYAAYLEVARDLALSAVFTLASVGGLRIILVAWNIYSLITFPFFVLAVFGAIDRLRAALGN